MPFTAIFTLLMAVLVLTFSLFKSNDWISRKMGYLWGRGLCLVALVKVSIEGKELLDQNQSYVFVANHASSFDIWVLYGWLDRSVRWVIKKELMKIPIFGFAARVSGQIPIDRSNSKKALESIEAAKKNIINGAGMAFFPEGTRSKDGRLGRFKRGAFLMAVDLELDMVPVVIKGAYGVKPPGNLFGNGGKIELQILKPISTQGYTKEDIPKLTKIVREQFKEVETQDVPKDNHRM